MPRSAILVVNAASRRGKEAWDDACAALEAAGIELTERYKVEDPGDLDAIIEDAIGKAPMVIVGGGDGTISGFVGHFRDKDTILAVLPLGTANSFARGLALPLDLDEAAAAIGSGEVRRIGIGCLNGEYFANVAAIGLSPLIADTIPDSLKRRFGMLGYVLWAIRIGFSFSAFRLRIKSGAKSIAGRATEVRIANGRYHGGVELVQGADLEDSDITVDAVMGDSLLKLALNWFLVLLHLRAQHRTMVEIEDRHLRIETDPPRDISIDGEIRARTPADIRLVPDAVNVVFPRETA
ncbi:diacylglycerol/lipid kinase family protein [Sphingomicrobium arenosum]|uniref:diacylglycerol/lipid kinase family protein n=1 Tax=Sphingomicrobium arenosum TaxID=2233861 RepID=UPI00223F1A4A|nr:YegS/Rv2252/BmrU family lipid kinase [Sphingomicrobium arenosum]